MESEYYLKEFDFFDGECFITFNIIEINFSKQTILVAVSNRGKLSYIEYDLREDEDYEYYFTYGYDFTKIYLKDFTD